MTKNAKQETNPLFMPTRPPGTSDEEYAEVVRQAAHRQHQALNRGETPGPRYALPRSPWAEDEDKPTAENRHRKAFVTLSSTGSSTATYID